MVAEGIRKEPILFAILRPLRASLPLWTTLGPWPPVLARLQTLGVERFLTRPKRDIPTLALARTLDIGWRLHQAAARWAILPDPRAFLAHQVEGLRSSTCYDAPRAGSAAPGWPRGVLLAPARPTVGHIA